MMLLQGDIKYGIKLPIGKNGAMVQTYLSSAIDDYSRYVIQSQFYDNQQEAIVEDTFRKVILKAGKFDSCYFDNGSQYIAKQLKLSLGKLGISIRYAPIRSGKSKGKYETKPSLIGGRVEISYDPMDTKTVTVRYQGVEPFTAEPVKIGSFCDKNPTLPESMTPKEAEASRMLNALEKQHEQSCQRRADAISFGSYRKDDGSNV